MKTTKNRGLLIKEYFFLLDQVTACIFHREAAPHSQVVAATIDLVFRHSSGRYPKVELRIMTSQWFQEIVPEKS